VPELYCSRLTLLNPFISPPHLLCPPHTCPRQLLGEVGRLGQKNESFLGLMRLIVYARRDQSAIVSGFVFAGVFCPAISAPASPSSRQQYAGSYLCRSITIFDVSHLYDFANLASFYCCDCLIVLLDDDVYLEENYQTRNVRSVCLSAVLNYITTNRPVALSSYY